MAILEFKSVPHIRRGCEHYIYQYRFMRSSELKIGRTSKFSIRITRYRWMRLQVLKYIPSAHVSAEDKNLVVKRVNFKPRS